MGKAKAVGASGASRRMRPTLSPEAEENQMISLAVDLAKKQLLEGTASSQVITHFLKLGSTRAQLEKELLATQRDLTVAKKTSLESAQRIEELYANAMKAMRSYSGLENLDDEP